MEQMIAVVQAYINHRTGKQVNIIITGFSDVVKLKQVYEYAIKWFENNNGSITNNF